MFDLLTATWTAAGGGGGVLTFETRASGGQLGDSFQIDLYDKFVVEQTTSGLMFMLPTPLNKNKRILIENSGSASFIMYGYVVRPQSVLSAQFSAAQNEWLCEFSVARGFDTGAAEGTQLQSNGKYLIEAGAIISPLNLFLPALAHDGDTIKLEIANANNVRINLLTQGEVFVF